METLMLWAHDGEDGKRVIRHAGPFAPKERVVTVCVPDGCTPDAVLRVIEGEYVKRGVSLECPLTPNANVNTT